MPDETVRVLIVEGRFYSDLSDELLGGATSALEAHGVQYDVVSVPGALEIPATVALADENALYDGYVALGVVIRGERSKPTSARVSGLTSPSFHGRSGSTSSA